MSTPPTPVTTTNLGVNYWASVAQFQAQPTISDAQVHFVPVPQVIDSYYSPTAWYRKWSDGFIEQGGLTTTTTTTLAITFPLPMSSTDYFVSTTGTSTPTSPTGNVTPYATNASIKSVTGMTLRAATATAINWEVKGY